MYIKEVITQERKIPRHATIAEKRYIGPLGTAKYLLHSDREIDVEEAVPFKVVLYSELFKDYNINHYTEMLRYFLVQSVYCNPTGFIINKYASTGTTHIYPMYQNEYIYMCSEESKLCDLSPITLLGLCPVTNDPLCWLSMSIPDPLRWGDTCVVRSEDRIMLSEHIHETIVETSRRRREGQQGVRDPPLFVYSR